MGQWKLFFRCIDRPETQGQNNFFWCGFRSVCPGPEAFFRASGCIETTRPNTIWTLVNPCLQPILKSKITKYFWKGRQSNCRVEGANLESNFYVISNDNISMKMWHNSLTKGKPDNFRHKNNLIWIFTPKQMFVKW